MVVADAIHRTVVGQRAGADKTHLAFQDIEELRQFVYAQSPDKPADPGYPGVVVGSPHRAALGGIFYHGPEFQDAENLVLMAQTLLMEDNRAPAVNLDGQGRQDQDGTGDPQK